MDERSAVYAFVVTVEPPMLAARNAMPYCEASARSASKICDADSAVG